MKDELLYLRKLLRIYWWNIIRWLNRHLLKTYPLIEDCARCMDCGRNVHDFIVPDDLWLKVVGSPRGVLCYDCFCNRADEKLGVKWRMEIIEWTNLKTGEKKRINLRSVT